MVATVANLPSRSDCPMEQRGALRNCSLWERQPCTEPMSLVSSYLGFSTIAPFLVCTSFFWLCKIQRKISDFSPLTLTSSEERRSWLLLIPLWLLSSSAKAIGTNIVTRCILWLSNWLIEALAKITVASYPLGYKLNGILIETKQKEKVPAFRPCGLVDPFLRFSIRAHLTSAMWQVSSIIQ